MNNDLKKMTKNPVRNFVRLAYVSWLATKICENTIVWIKWYLKTSTYGPKTLLYSCT